MLKTRSYNDPTRPKYIYSLEGVAGDIRYVGATFDCRRRFEHHTRVVRGKRKPVECWIMWLRFKGSKPVLRILEIVPAGVDWGPREQFWISEGRRLGWRLLNHTDGGQGVTGLKFSKEALAKIAKASTGRVLGEKSRESIGSKKSTWWKTRTKEEKDTVAARISNARKGYIIPRKVRAKLCKSSRAYWDSPRSVERRRAICENLSSLTWEIVRALRAEYATGLSQKDLAVKYGIEPSQVSRIVNNKKWKE